MPTVYKVFVVNGLDQPYTVTINGEQHTLPPASRRRCASPKGR